MDVGLSRVQAEIAPGRAVVRSGGSEAGVGRAARGRGGRDVWSGCHARAGYLMTVLRRGLAVYRRAQPTLVGCPSGGRERLLRALLVPAPLDRRQRRSVTP